MAKDLEPFVKAMYRKLEPFVEVPDFNELDNSNPTSETVLYGKNRSYCSVMLQDPWMSP